MTQLVSFNAWTFISYPVWPFIFNVILFMEHQYSTFHGTSNRDNYRTVHWSSSGPGFHLKIDALFIHVQIMGLDLILYWKTRNYQKIIFLNLKVLLCAWWPIFFAIIKDIALFKIYFKSLVFSKQKAVVLRFEIVGDIKFSV